MHESSSGLIASEICKCNLFYEKKSEKIDFTHILAEKEFIINMVLVTYSILATVLKWRPANGVVYTFAEMCVKSIFSDFFSLNKLHFPTITNFRCYKTRG